MPFGHVALRFLGDGGNTTQRVEEWSPVKVWWAEGPEVASKPDEVEEMKSSDTARLEEADREKLR